MFWFCGGDKFLAERFALVWESEMNQFSNVDLKFGIQEGKYCSNDSGVSEENDGSVK